MPPLEVNSDGTLPMKRSADGRTYLDPDVAAALGDGGDGGGPHTHDYAAPDHGHDYADPHAHPYAADDHSHLETPHPDLADHLTLGLSASHDHPYAATVHTHAYSADDHTHAGGETLPSGVIVMWAGLLSGIPSGWRLCDGQNGTPDLRDRFVKGAANGANPGTTGGTATHTHDAHTGVINHTHGVTVTDPGHTHGQGYRNSGTAGTAGIQGASTANNATIANGVPSATTGISATTANPVGGVASLTHSSPNHEPPFYALAFIQKV
jgi:hypothetical protein